MVNWVIPGPSLFTNCGDDFAFSNRIGRGVFAPTDISNLELWLDAQAITASEDDPITTWSDLSGNSRDFTQASASRKPLYKGSGIGGKAALLFDGGDDYLENATAADWKFLHNGSDTTFFCVIHHLVAGDDGIFCNNRVSGAQIGNSYDLFSNNSANQYMTAGSGVVVINSTTAASQVAVTTDYYLSYNYDNGAAGDDAKLCVNDVEKATSDTLAAHSSSNGSFNMSVGSGGGPIYFFDGYIGEIIAYSKALTDAEMSKVETHLSSRWGI